MLTRAVRFFLRLLSFGAATAVASIIAGPTVAADAAAITQATELKPETKTIDLASVRKRTAAPQTDRVISALALEHKGTNEQVAIRDERYEARFAHLQAQNRPTATPKATRTPTQSVPIVTASTPNVTSTPTERVIETPTPTPKPTASPTPIIKHLQNTGKVASMIAFARAQLGEPYVFAGAGPNVWDCSGLTLKAFASVGISIGTHSATNQYYTAADRGDLVDYANRKPGDLIFYTDGSGDMYHVTIYTGGGMMIEAPREGVPVREVPVRAYDRASKVARFIR